jgi:hypothetical protein
MLYLSELMANATMRQAVSLLIKEPNVRSETVSETAAEFPRFL